MWSNGPGFSSAGFMYCSRTGSVNYDGHYIPGLTGFSALFFSFSILLGHAIPGLSVVVGLISLVDGQLIPVLAVVVDFS